MSKARWIVGGYAATAVVFAVLWVILRATGEPGWRAVGMATLLALSLWSFGLAGLWIWAAAKASRGDRVIPVFLASVRLLQGAGFALIIWTRWLGVALIVAAVVVDLVGRRILRRYVLVSDTDGV